MVHRVKIQLKHTQRRPPRSGQALGKKHWAELPSVGKRKVCIGEGVGWGGGMEAEGLWSQRRGFRECAGH